MLAALVKSAHPAAKKALAEIYNAENNAAAVKATHTFATEYGAKWPRRWPRSSTTSTAPHLVALVRAGARFEGGQLVERSDESGGDQQAA